MLNININDLKNVISLNYGLDIKELKPVEFGEDNNAERLKLRDAKNNAYFIKVVKKVSDNNLKLLSYLGKSLGDCIITPIENIDDRLYTRFDDHFIVVYPFIEGKNGFEEVLNSQNLENVGKIIRRLHSLDSEYLKDKVGIGQYIHKPDFRSQVRQMLMTIEYIKTVDSLVLDFKDFIKSNSVQLHDILNILDNLSNSIIDDDFNLFLCHTDIHVGNILKASNGKLYIVDWDQAALGPKELDLLFFGGGIAGYLNDEAEIKSFYSGYGDCSIDYRKLAFYRFARLVEDIAIYHKEIVDVTIDYDRRKQALLYLRSNFNPGETIECAFRTLQHIK